MSQLQLIELLSTGARQAFALDELQAIKVRVGAVYSVVEADTSEAPEGLLLKRKEDTLEVEVDGEVVANLEGFYAEDASSSFLVEDAEGDTGSVVIGPDDVPQAENSNIVWEPESDSVNWGWYAGGGALAAAALAAGGGGGGGGNGDDSDTSPPTIVSDDGSGRILITVDENTGAGQVIYTVTADEAATFSLKPGQGDVDSFSIGSGGQVILIDSPDFESQSRYEFVVVATDTAGNSSEQTVTLTVNNLAPAITSQSAATPINESIGANQVIYQVTANEPATFSLKPELDADSFTINEEGQITLTGSPDFAEQASYSFTVVAEDAAGNTSEQTVTLAVIDPNSTDNIPPTITSGPVANDIDENSGPGQVVYTATANEAAIFELEGADADSFTINDDNQVILTDSPDFESKASYEFTIVATDAAGNRGEQEVSLAINDLPPTITSGAVAPAINENSGANQVVYTAVATESPTFSLLGPDAGSFSIDANSGTVTLTESPDFEAQASYSFTVVAEDGGGEDRQAVTLAINNLPDTDTTPPTINSENTATAIDENSGSGQRIYTATANESATFSLGPGPDQSNFSINPATGAVFLTVNPDFETQFSYQFSVIAEDDAGNRSEPFVVTLPINDLDEIAPKIMSGATASVDENSAANQVVYTAQANEDATFSLAGADAASLNINANSGAVTLINSPDFESQASYSFTVIAEDPAGNRSEPFAVTLAVVNLPPVITSDSVAPAIDENSGPDQVVYTATANEDATFSLDGTDAGSFNITNNGSSAAVTLIASPDFEVKSSYSFEIVATDGAGEDRLTVTLAINDLDDIPPNIESQATAPAVDEGTPALQVIYTAIANEEATFSLAGNDAGSFDISPINETTASVILLESPDFDDQSSYSFIVVAEDAAGNIGQQTVTLAVNQVFDVGETAPTAVMFDLAPALADHSAQALSVSQENSGAIKANSDDHIISPGTGEAWADAGNLTAVDQATFVGSGSNIMGQSDLSVANLRLVAEVSAGDVLSLQAQSTPVITTDLLTQSYKALSYSASDGASSYASNGQATVLWSGQAGFYSALSNPSFGQSYSQTLPAYVTLPV